MADRNLSEIAGQRVRYERERLNMSLEDLASAIGSSASSLSRIERGQRGLDSLLLRRISKELQVPMDRFFLETEVETIHAREGVGPGSAMAEMIDWGRRVFGDLQFVLREERRHGN